MPAVRIENREYEEIAVRRIRDPISAVQGLEIPAHDFIALTYTGNNLTGVVYKEGGSGGATVATLVLAYDGNNNLTSVTKS